MAAASSGLKAASRLSSFAAASKHAKHILMARRQSNSIPPPIEIRPFTLPEIESAIRKLRRRIDDVHTLDPKQVRFDDAQIGVVERNIRDTIREIFGQRSPEFHDHEHLRIRSGGYYVGESDSESQQHFAEGIPQTITVLDGLVSRLEEKREDLELQAQPPAKETAPLLGTRRIFLVHGHDEAAKNKVARFLESLKLVPIILHEQPSQGRTVIEKFEGNADVDFAVVLLTPDDVGQPADGPGELQPRARQNVIFELGYFAGRLGRPRVCALHTGGVEILSDYQGILYVPMDGPNDWQLSLAREIKAAGIDVDLNLAV